MQVLVLCANINCYGLHADVDAKACYAVAEHNVLVVLSQNITSTDWCLCCCHCLLSHNVSCVVLLKLLWYFFAVSCSDIRYHINLQYERNVWTEIQLSVSHSRVVFSWFHVLCSRWPWAVFTESTEFGDSTKKSYAQTQKYIHLPPQNTSRHLRAMRGEPRSFRVGFGMLAGAPWTLNST